LEDLHESHRRHNIHLQLLHLRLQIQCMDLRMHHLEWVRMVQIMRHFEDLKPLSISDHTIRETTEPTRPQLVRLRT